MNRAVVERDLWRWRRQLAAMRGTVSRPTPERAVLFSELMATHATAKFESVIGSLLGTKGYRSVILLEKPDRPIKQFFRASVPDAEFVYLSEEITCERQRIANEKAREIVAGTRNLHDLIELEIDGFRVGRNVMSIILRQFRLGRLVNENSEQRAAVVKMLGRSLAVKEFASWFLGQRKIDLAIFNERGYTPPGEVFDGCTLTGVDTIQWCGVPQADRLLFRRYRPENRSEHPLTFSDKTWRAIQGLPWTQDDDRAIVDQIASGYASGTWYSKQQLQEGRRIVDAERVRSVLNLDPKKKTAVIFCHMFYDAAFFYGNNMFDDYEQWLIETTRSAIENPALNWIVKVHPANVWRSRMDGKEMTHLEVATLNKHFGTLPEHVKVMTAETEISTFSLFRAADYGLTVRGTIGLELPCFGIPVVTAGTGRYSGRGFTIDPKTRGEYRALLARLHEIPPLNQDAIRLARLHYFSTFELMPVRMRSVVLDYFAKPKADGVFISDVSLRHPADESLLATDDLGSVINWMTETDLPELLAQGSPAGL